MNIEVKDNKILNLDKIKELIDNDEINYDALKNMLNLLINNPSYKEVLNKDELIAIINQKVNRIEKEKSNKEALKKLKEINENFNNLSIIETKKEDNDSLNNIDYLVLEDEKQNIKKVINFRFGSSVNDFINNHSDLIANWDSEKLFNYFSENVSKELKEENINDSTLNNNDEIIQSEKEELEKFKEKYELDFPINVTINYYNERIYIIGGYFIKFKSNLDNKRIMQILKKPEITIQKEDNKIEDGYDELMNELDGELKEEKFEENIINEEEKVKENNEIKEEIINYSKEYGYFSIDSLEKIDDIVEKEADGFNLTSDDIHYKYSVMKKLVKDMIKFSQDPILYEKETGISTNVFKNYISSLIKPLVIKKQNEEKLSNIELEIVKEYLNNKDYCNNLLKKDKANLDMHKDKILIKKNNEESHGITLIVILLEIIAIAMLTLLFLSIDI